MKRNLYVLRDHVSGDFILASSATTDGAFVRDVIAGFVTPFRPLNEFEYYKVGTIDDTNGMLEYTGYERCDNNAYKLPENKTRPLTAEEIERLAAAVKKGGK